MDRIAPLTTGDKSGVGDEVSSVSIDSNGNFILESSALLHCERESLIGLYSGNLPRVIAHATKEERLLISKHVLCAVDVLHKQGIFHGGICAENVNWKENSLSLTNAGLRASIQRYLKYIPLLPCTRYRTREELMCDEWAASKAADIYAATVLVHVIFEGEKPYSMTPLIRVVSKLASVGHTKLERPTMMPLALWNALDSFWKANPENRPAAFLEVQATILLQNTWDGTL